MNRIQTYLIATVSLLTVMSCQRDVSTEVYTGKDYSGQLGSLGNKSWENLTYREKLDKDEKRFEEECRENGDMKLYKDTRNERAAELRAAGRAVQNYDYVTRDNFKDADLMNFYYIGFDVDELKENGNDFQENLVSRLFALYEESYARQGPLSPEQAMNAVKSDGLLQSFFDKGNDLYSQLNEEGVLPRNYPDNFSGFMAGAMVGGGRRFNTATARSFVMLFADESLISNEHESNSFSQGDPNSNVFLGATSADRANMKKMAFATMVKGLDHNGALSTDAALAVVNMLDPGHRLDFMNNAIASRSGYYDVNSGNGKETVEIDWRDKDSGSMSRSDGATGDFSDQKTYNLFDKASFRSLAVNDPGVEAFMGKMEPYSIGKKAMDVESAMEQVRNSNAQYASQIYGNDLIAETKKLLVEAKDPEILETMTKDEFENALVVKVFTDAVRDLGLNTGLGLENGKIAIPEGKALGVAYLNIEDLINPEDRLERYSPLKQKSEYLVYDAQEVDAETVLATNLRYEVFDIQGAARDALAPIGERISRIDINDILPNKTKEALQREKSFVARLERDGKLEIEKEPEGMSV